MKSIFVPTDFSACASNAVDVAMQIAEKFGANVHLYTRLDLPYNWHTMSDTEKKANAEATQNVKNAEILFKEIKSNYPNIEITTSFSGGSLIENISDYTKKYAIDLVVMGSHGIGGVNEIFMGSNTQRAVRFVHCPVLVVKDKIETLDFKKVVFASNFNVEEKEPFLKFKNFIKHFIPEIHLVAIHGTSFWDAPLILQREVMNDFKELAKPFACKTHIFRDYSVDKGIDFFADQIGADLIAISNHNRHPLKRIFVGSNVEALVNHANLPVLTIDYSEK